MPKAFSLVRILIPAIASAVIFGFCRGAHGEVPPKLEPLAICPALRTAAETNRIALTRIDPSSDATNTLRAGDAATILGTLVLKKTRAQWLLSIEAAAPKPPKDSAGKPPPPMVIKLFDTPEKFESRPVPAKLRMLGPFPLSGASKQITPEDKTTRFWLNESFLAVGLDKAADVIARRYPATNSNAGPATHSHADVKLTAAEKRAISGAVPALMSYLEIVQHTEGLEDLLFKLVKMPSLWSIIRHGGVEPGLHIGKEATRANAADWNLPAAVPVYYFPCLFTLNGQPAVKITLVVTSPHPPLLICGGVIALLAEKPGDNDTYMTLRVISAHRGPKPENEIEPRDERKK